MFDNNIFIVTNKKIEIDDDIDRGRENDDEGVRAWESNLIRGSAIPGQNPDETLMAQPADPRPLDVRISEKISDVKVSFCMFFIHFSERKQPHSSYSGTTGRM